MVCTIAQKRSIRNKEMANNRKKAVILYWFNLLLGNDYPCGRTKKDKHLCCLREIKESNIVYSEDRKTAYCKFCGHIRMMSNVPIESTAIRWD